MASRGLLGAAEGLGRAVEKVGTMFMSHELEKLREERLAAARTSERAEDRAFQKETRNEERNFQKEVRGEDRAFQKDMKAEDRKHQSEMLQEKMDAERQLHKDKAEIDAENSYAPIAGGDGNLRMVNKKGSVMTPTEKKTVTENTQYNDGEYFDDADKKQTQKGLLASASKEVEQPISYAGKSGTDSRSNNKKQYDELVAQNVPHDVAQRIAYKTAMTVKDGATGASVVVDSRTNREIGRMVPNDPNNPYTSGYSWQPSSNAPYPDGTVLEKDGQKYIVKNGVPEPQ